uniref:Uncharacterized protein n=1 Tax=Arundo donax TaxID=35708 RepID=A0A0A8ZR30_ARUDO
MQGLPYDTADCKLSHNKNQQGLQAFSIQAT